MRLQNPEERNRLENCILQSEWLADHTSDPIAANKYYEATIAYALMYHRIIGDYYRRSPYLQKTIVGSRR